MRPKTVGRALGIGARFAGRALLDGKTPARQTSPEAARQAQVQRVEAAGQRARSAGLELGQTTRTSATKVGRGTRNFSRAVWNPFAHATSVLWLEVTGLFFALFAVFFTSHLYTLRAAWRAGPDHRRFLLYALLTLLFVYFSVSSFIRANRRQPPVR